MWKSLAYKNKMRLLLAGSLLLIVIVWQFALKKTIALRSEATRLEEISTGSSASPEEVAQLKSTLSELDAIIGTGNTGEKDARRSLLGFLTSYCAEKKILLKNLPETSHKNENGFTVETNIFTLEGAFKDLLGLHYLLEQKNRIGRIASTRYAVRTDPKSKKKILSATLYMQNIKSTTHE